MTFKIPADYIERVYAGVLGKIIGVYLGRPFENASYDDMANRIGEIWYYVHEKLNQPLVVTDDDISGTFTFLRALADNGYDPDLTPRQIGENWLNYIVEDKTILWWGGMGRSTEHTAFLRLKAGIDAPRSGSAEVNGKVVAEQIGAQIFIDGWGMVCPGDPERAADFARRAASVSHDGEAIYGAQIVAAIEALAFVKSDIPTLIRTALTFIPDDCVIRRLIDDIFAWHAEAPDDWRATYAKIAAKYGYDKFGGGCHMVPNHAMIINALLHGDGDFQKSLMVANTCGWDTDCNSGNVGCILGIRGGLAVLDSGPDYRGPVADRLYLPTADGGRCISDAIREAYEIADAGFALSGVAIPPRPKNGARFHFALPGSVQGWRELETPDSRGTILSIGNENGRLDVRFSCIAERRPARVATDTFIFPDALKVDGGGYSMYASPTLYPGQTVEASVLADHVSGGHVSACLFVQVYDSNDQLTLLYAPAEPLAADGVWTTLRWTLPPTGGFPIARVGLEIASTSGKRTEGKLIVDSLTWTGVPDTTLGPTAGGNAWQRAWVPAVDIFERAGSSFRIIQNKGIGLLIQGCREWTDYSVEATLTAQMASAIGLAVRVQGLRRYYSLRLTDTGVVELTRHRDGETTVLASQPFPFDFGQSYALAFEADGDTLRGSIDGATTLTATDTSEHRLRDGAIAVVTENGNVTASDVRIRPLQRTL